MNLWYRKIQKIKEITRVQHLERKKKHSVPKCYWEGLKLMWIVHAILIFFFLTLLFPLWTCSLCVHRKTKQTKKFADFNKTFRRFSKFSKIEFWWRQIFKISIFHKPSLGSLDVPQKIWIRSVQPFWRLLDTNRQTKFIYRLEYPLK